MIKLIDANSNKTYLHIYIDTYVKYIYIYMYVYRYSVYVDRGQYACFDMFLADDPQWLILAMKPPTDQHIVDYRVQ